ncbi:glycerophosphodiester phosphodiesterase [Ningiella sp. W23]|uniref:glycerophosphodiester phosphodiesterase n=1 Tax=Ningiella sp. W23 TaxID=3023715 RepID=UPI0037571344
MAIDIIAHRAASGFLPEHTKEALVLSFMQGADYIEQDLVVTKDNQLVVLHDIYLENVTDVESVFPKRVREDGRWYAVDFTLSELRQLRVHERENNQKLRVYAQRYQGHAHFTIASFEEHIELIQSLNYSFDKQVGIYPEIKAYHWHLSEGKDISQLLFNILKKHQLNSADARIFVQSFEPAVLKRLRFDMGAKFKMTQLLASNSWDLNQVDYELLTSDEGLRNIASYAQAIGPWIPKVIDINTDTSTGLVQRAQKHGLAVHPFTFRSDVINQAMPADVAFSRLQALGLDGIFTDHVMPYMLHKPKEPEL